MDLLPKLKSQHKQILKSLWYIPKCIEKCQNPQLRKDFKDFESLLVNHMQLEDYIYVRPGNSKQKELREMAKVFSKEMIILSKTILAFFRKYGYLDMSKLKKNKKFKDELKNITESVKRRVLIEEDILFPTFKKYKF